MLTSNELFGNNILIYLSESFNISSYLILQYLSNSLIESNIDFDITDLNNIINLINNSSIVSSNLTKNYLDENLQKLDIPDSIENIIIESLLNTNTEEQRKINEKILILNKKYPELKTVTTSHPLTPLYTSLEKDLTKLKTNASNLSSHMDPGKLKLTPKSKADAEIIKKYNKNIKKDNTKNIGLLIYAWSKLLKKPIDNNYNLVPIYLLNKQKEIIKSFDITKLNDLLVIEKVMSHWSSLAESYFTTKKYTQDNTILKFIEELLNYITKLVIGNGIELMMRRILMTWLQNATIIENKDYKQINDIIKFILESTIEGITNTLGDPTNMLKELYEVVCPKLVKNSAEIFFDKSYEQAHSTEQVKEILIEYFQLLDVAPYSSYLTDEIKNIFRTQVVNYFDTFISRSILLWLVNIENILKYFINNHRCLRTFIELVN
jgi:hypothetical protein